MAFTYEIVKPSDRAASSHFMRELKNIVKVITAGSGILKRIHIWHPESVIVYVKLWNTDVAVTPASDNPDFQFAVHSSPGGSREVEYDFDTVLGTFSGGLQIAASTGKGLNDAAPTTGCNVQLVIE